MKRLLLLLLMALLSPLPAFADEPPALSEEDQLALEQLTAEDLEILQNLQLLELLDMLRDMETVARLEDES